MRSKRALEHGRGRRPCQTPICAPAGAATLSTDAATFGVVRQGRRRIALVVAAQTIRVLSATVRLQTIHVVASYGHEWIRTPAASGRLLFRLVGGTYFTLPPRRAQTGQELLDRRAGHRDRYTGQLKTTLVSSQYVLTVSFMNTLSLSVSKPSNANGIRWRIVLQDLSQKLFAPEPAPARTPSILSRCPSVSGFARSCLSPTTRRAPRDPPRRNPGGGSFQSAKVRTGTLRRIAAEGGALRRFRAPAPSLTSRRTRSIVAALIAIRLTRNAGPSLRWPFHRIDQDRHQRPQPLAANPVRGFPDHDQSLAHRLII
jgi:hypothetical protein